MKFLKKLLSICLIFILLLDSNKAIAAFDVRGVQLFKDSNVCLTMADNTTNEGFNLANIQSNQESIQSKVSSSGSFCPLPPFFTGGALLTTSPKTIQAQANVQSLGRGILISEIAGDTGGISSSGDPTGFSSLLARLGGTASAIFEITLPSGCDVVDDDDDIAGASSDLTTVNDFSLPTCTSTNSLTVQCNAASGLLTTVNGLVPASGGNPAKIRFAISAIDSTPDVNMIDSILIKFDSQDIFCPGTITGPLIATVIAKNAVDSPTKSETLGTADLGTPTQAIKISYAKDSATSLKGEISTNEVSTTPLLIGKATTTSNIIQIEELHNESIPIGSQSSPTLINSSLANSNVEISTINLLLIPTSTILFLTAPSASDITFSDNSLLVSSAPVIVKNNGDDLNAPIGTLVIPVKKNPIGSDPSGVKTTITIKNLVFNSSGSVNDTSTVSLALFEPISGAVVNTPSALSVNNSTNPTNPQNFSAFSVGSVRALAQNAVINGAANELTDAAQVAKDVDLVSLTARNTILGTPQITGFTKAISSVTSIDTNKTNIIITGSVVTVTGQAGASISGAKIKIDLLVNNSTFDSVTITSKGDGSFVAKLKSDGSNKPLTVNFKQTISDTDSAISTKTVETSGSGVSTNLTCDKTVCGCENPNCTPTIPTVLVFVENSGGLSAIVSKGGATLEELIKVIKNVLGLS